MKTHTAVRITTLVLLASLLLACETEEPGQPGSPQLINSQQSACKPHTAIPSLSGGTLETQLSGSDLLVMHRDASYNCAAKVQMTGSVSGSDILVTETITNPDDTMVRCMCPYDLSVVVKGLGPGIYQVKVTDSEGKLVGSASVTVGPAAAAVEQLASTQSACKAPPQGFADGNLRATITAGVLSIVHVDAEYNCAAKVELTAEISGNVILVTETIVNPDDPMARCMCPFDLSVGLKGVPAGSYVIKVVDTAGQAMGTLQVTVHG